jgi:histidinol-phosphate aminotransferase
MRRLWRRALEAITPYQAGPALEQLQRELGLSEIVRLSSNETPIGPSPRVIEAIRREAPRVHLYPDGGSSALREAIARWAGAPADWLVVGNGGDEIISMISRAVLDPGDEVVVPKPSFEPYTSEAHLAEAVVVDSPLADYHQDLDDMLRRVTPRTKLVYVCTPHNPTGTIVRGGPLKRFLEALGPDGPLVVLDEAYRDFCDDPDTPDGVRLIRDHANVVSLRTFSKIAGLAGLRVGFAVARPEAIAQLNRVRAPFNVNRLAQVAAVAALEDPEHLARTAALVRAERARVREALLARGASVPPSQSNFLLVRVGDRADALRAALLKAGILVRDGALVGFPGHLRISEGTPASNDRLLAVWDQTLR